MNKTVKIFVLLFLLSVISDSCKKEENQPTIPSVPVNFSINPNGTEYIRLNTVNGWEYLTGGYRGIIVSRISQNEFSAFERACPYDWDKTSTRIEVDTSGVTAYCPSCLSKFILNDGTPYAGPSRYPLLKYQTYYDGNLLHISN